MRSNDWIALSLKVVDPVLGHVPIAVLHNIASAAGTIAYLTNGSARTAMTENAAVVLGLKSDHPRVRGAARRAFQIDAKNWIDTLRIGKITRAQLLSLVDLCGWQAMEEAVAQKRGVVLVSLHLGNYDLVGQTISARGVPVMIPVERIEPIELFDMLTTVRRAHGIDVVPIEDAPRAMVRILRRGGVVAIQGDRHVAGKTACIPFFGRETRMSTTPASMARRWKLPVVIAVGVRKGHGRFDGFVIPVPMSFAGPSESVDVENTQRITQVLEVFIAHYIDQWLMFTPMWGSDASVDSAATIKLKG